MAEQSIIGSWDFLGLRGCSHPNADGSSRLAECRKLRIEEPVRVVREPDNANDPDALFVESERGVGIGYVNRVMAGKIAADFDRAERVVAYVSRIDTERPFSVWITLTLYGESRPRKPTQPRSPKKQAGGGCAGVATVLFGIAVLSALAIG